MNRSVCLLALTEAEIPFFLLFFSSKVIELIFCYHYYVSVCVTVILLLEIEPINLRLMAYKLRR